MEIVTLLLIIVILIIIINFKNDISGKLNYLQERMQELNDKLSKQTIVEKPISQPKPVEEKKPVPPPTLPKTEYWESNFKVEEEIAGAKPDPVKQPSKQADAFEIKPTIKELLAEQQPIFEVPPPKPTFFERNPDLEKFIGENLISKIGIGILVLAIGFFVKYAIDNNWIGEVGRVGIGLLCGAILVGIAHRLRNGYKAFSSVLVGGGIAVFYFTISLAYHNFHLFGQTTSFIIMVGITAFAVAISLLYDRQELAIISLIGGFTAPFLVSDGSGHYQTLFIYLIVLNAGLLIIAYNKAWRLLNLLAFVFTVLIFGSWLLLSADNKVATYKNGFIYASIFYLLFFAINIANNIKENKKFLASDFGILLANTSLYFGAGLYCILNMHGEQYKGLFSASMGIFNLAASYFLFRNRKVDTNILYLLIGITLTFVSLTAPLQLHGNYITLFWASETALLFWLYQKSKIAIFQLSSFIIWILMLVSLAMDCFWVYEVSTSWIPIIFNKAFITTVYCSLASYLVYRLIAKQDEENAGIWLSKKLFMIASLVLLFLSGALETFFQFDKHYPFTGLSYFYLLFYIVLFIWLLLLVTKKFNTLLLNNEVRLGLLSCSIISYFLAVHLNYVVQEKVLAHDGIAEIISKQQFSLFFIGHWITALLMASTIYQLIKAIRLHNATYNSSGFLTWLLCAVSVAFLSVEIHLLMNALFHSSNNTLATIERVYIKTGLPILWGLCSFAFMWLGMKHKYRPLRIISLILFSITLLKLFLFDISNIPIAGKIAAFFCLGVILLVVSFMYQRLKKIIIEDEKKTEL